MTFVAADNEALTREDGFLPKSYAVEALIVRFLESAGDVKGAEDAIANASSLLSRVKPQAVLRPTTLDLPKDVAGGDDAHEKQHIMISYCWKPMANPQLVAHLASCLRYSLVRFCG